MKTIQKRWCELRNQVEQAKRSERWSDVQDLRIQMQNLVNGKEKTVDCKAKGICLPFSICGHCLRRTMVERVVLREGRELENVYVCTRCNRWLPEREDHGRIIPPSLLPSRDHSYVWVLEED